MYCLPDPAAYKAFTYPHRVSGQALGCQCPVQCSGNIRNGIQKGTIQVKYHRFDHIKCLLPPYGGTSICIIARGKWAVNLYGFRYKNLRKANSKRFQFHWLIDFPHKVQYAMDRQNSDGR